MAAAGWKRFGKTCEVDGYKIKKTSGANYMRHATHGETLSSGVHSWEVMLSEAAIANGNRQVYVGVASEGLDVEKGNHCKKGVAWYLRTENGHGQCVLLGEGAPAEDPDPAAFREGVSKSFRVGDRIGVKLNCDDGSLRFYHNGEAIETGFPAGTITGPVTPAVELLCIGQSLTLLPAAATLA